MSEDGFGVAYDEASATLTVRGIIDELSIRDLEAALARASRDFARSVTVDLSDVSFLPSIGLGLLATSMGRAHEAGAVLTVRTRPDALAFRILQISGLPYTVS